MGALPPDHERPSPGRQDSALVSSEFVLGQWCETVLSALCRAGVTDLVISPGSRNTPLTATALRHDGLTCHSVIDERSAAFFALGLSKTGKRRAALLCTSGSAGAHYLPALIEAYYAQVPLIALTADRPEELQNCGAPQTIQQPGLFGHHVRGSLALGAPSGDLREHQRLSNDLLALINQSLGPVAGPVHVNVPFSKPLEPRRANTPAEFQLGQALKELRAKLLFSAATPSAPRSSELDMLLVALTKSRHPLLTAGPLTGPALLLAEDFARANQLPLLKEYGAGDSCGLFEFLAPHVEQALAPDFVLHMGPPVVSSAWARWLSGWDGAQFILPGPVHQDPSRRARQVLKGDLPTTIKALAQGAPPAPDRSEHLARVSGHLAKVRSVLQGQLTSQRAAQLGGTPDDGERISEPNAIHAALRALAPNTVLMLANSLPLRISSWMVSQLDNDAPLSAPITARGANGIDGTIAWAGGVTQSEQRPGLLLIGDVALSHDLSSLALVSQLSTPLVIVLVDNAGGRIFDHLPARDTLTDAEFEYWTTTPTVDFEKAAEAFGISYRRVVTLPEVTPTLREVLSGQQPIVVHLRTEPDSTVKLARAVRGELTQ